MKNRIHAVGYALFVALVANLIFLVVFQKTIFLINCILVTVSLILITVTGFLKSLPSANRAREKLSNRQWLDANTTKLHGIYGNTWLAIADEQVIASDKSRNNLLEHIRNSPYKGKDVLIYFIEM